MGTSELLRYTLAGVLLIGATACGGVEDEAIDSAEAKADGTGQRQAWRCTGVCAESGMIPGCPVFVLKRFTRTMSTGHGYDPASALDDLRQNCADQGYDREGYVDAFGLLVNPHSSCDVGGKTYYETHPDWLIEAQRDACRLVSQPVVSSARPPACALGFAQRCLMPYGAWSCSIAGRQICSGAPCDCEALEGAARPRGTAR